VLKNFTNKHQLPDWILIATVNKSYILYNT